ncbi:MAG: SUMF1/EgtB/PvdO family nonheme iron enzyme [bacterium]
MSENSGLQEAGRPADVLATYRAALCGQPPVPGDVHLRVSRCDPPGPAVPLWTLIEPGCRLVVSGPPGSGKTTLAAELVALAGGPVVVRVEAARLLAGHPFDAAQADLRAAVGPVRSAGLAEALRAEPGRVWVLVDGLDEAVAAARDAVEMLAQTLGEAALVVFDSGACFHDPRLGLFEEARVLPLSFGDQADRARAHLGDRGGALVAHLRASLGLHRLARRPGTLQLLIEAAEAAWVAGEALPTRPAAVFARVVDHRLAGLPAPAEARFALAHLALALVSLGEPPWSREVLVGTLAALAAGHRVPGQAAAHRALHADAAPRIHGALAANRAPAGRLFIHRVAVATGLMVEKAGGFLFADSGLQAALAASVLAQRPVAEVTEAGRVAAASPGAPERWLQVFARYAEGTSSPVDTLYGLVTSGLAQDALVRVGGADPREVLAGMGLIDRYRTLADAWRDDPAARATLRAWVGPGSALSVCAEAHHALASIGRAEDDALFFARIGSPQYRAPQLARLAVPAGSFQRGEHTIQVGAFELATTLVTEAQYAAFDTSFVPGPDPSAPMSRASWYVAWLFCRWVGGRLPTVAEWERAYRAGLLADEGVGEQWCHDWWRWPALRPRIDPVGPVGGAERSTCAEASPGGPPAARGPRIPGRFPWVADGRIRVAWGAEIPPLVENSLNP